MIAIVIVVIFVVISISIIIIISITSFRMNFIIIALRKLLYISFF